MTIKMMKKTKKIQIIINILEIIIIIKILVVIIIKIEILKINYIKIKIITNLKTKQILLKINLT